MCVGESLIRVLFSSEIFYVYTTAFGYAAKERTIQMMHVNPRTEL